MSEMQTWCNLAGCKGNCGTCTPSNPTPTKDEVELWLPRLVSHCTDPQIREYAIQMGNAIAHLEERVAELTESNESRSYTIQGLIDANKQMADRVAELAEWNSKYYSDWRTEQIRANNFEKKCGELTKELEDHSRLWKCACEDAGRLRRQRDAAQAEAKAFKRERDKLQADVEELCMVTNEVHRATERQRDAAVALLRVATDSTTSTLEYYEVCQKARDLLASLAAPEEQT